MSIDVGYVLSRSVGIIQKNPGILVPALLPAAVSLIFAAVVGSVFTIPLMNPAVMMSLMGIVAIYAILMIILSVIAGGAIVAMAYVEVSGGNADYRYGFSRAIENFPQLLVASILIAIGVLIGSLLLVIPGLIFALLVIFTVQEIIVKGKGAIDAISGSIEIVKGNFLDVLIFAIVLFVIVAIVNIALSIIPVVGSFIAMLIITPFVSVAITVAYTQIA